MSNEKFGYPPPGGDTGQVLTKRSAESGDYDWEPGGGGLALAGINDLFLSDADTIVVADGQPVSLKVVTAAPPDWLDGAGNIILPGLYLTGLSASHNTAATIPGLFFTIVGRNILSAIIPIDPLLNYAAVTGDYLSLLEADLPFSSGGQIIIQNDATAAIAAKAFIARLAH